MVKLEMIFHDVFPGEWFVAYRAVHSQFVCLVLTYHVSVEIVLVSEALPTQLTRMPVDPAMCVQMCLQVVLARESFPANGAREAFTRRCLQTSKE